MKFFKRGKIMTGKTLVKKDFEALRRLRFCGKICEGVDAELYFVNCIDGEDAAVSQTIRTHSHDFFEIHFVLCGSITYTVGETRLSATENSFLIIPDSVMHTVESYTENMLKVSVAVKVGRDEPLFHGLKENGLKVLFVDSEALITVKHCTEAAQDASPYKLTLIKNSVLALLCHISAPLDSFSAKGVSEGDGESDVRLFKAKQFIRDNPGAFLGCRELAQYCNVSPKQLNRIFLKSEGMTLLKYIHNEKLRQAKELLRGGERTLSEISDQLGFSSVYYFSRFFTEREGVSPGLYKKER